MNDLDAVKQLRSTRAVRERAATLLARARDGGSPHFTVDVARLDVAAAETDSVTRARDPSLDIPDHSRWRQCEAGGVDRRAMLDARLGDASPAERARTHIDLALVAVLLDAGAGPDWGYADAATGTVLTRSEGLGVASLEAFMAGLFSSDPSRPLQVDAGGLRRLDAAALARAFQAGDANPLVGLDGRVALLRRLGDALAAQPAVFGTAARPGGLFDTVHGELAVHELFVTLLDTLSPIWPASPTLDGVPLGDCWHHETVGWMPFHKLTQWLTYSLIEPFEWAGIRVNGLDDLTGLPEYRNGGLLLDTGVIVPRDAAWADRAYAVGDAFVVEWRALTVALLDELAPLVRDRLGRTAEQMPLACALEGGTWATGRELARRLRGGLPPVNVASDGTVF